MNYKEIFGEDEVSSNAMGGTELMKMKLMETVDHELLVKHQIIVSRPRDCHFENDKKRILWLHDHHADPEAQKLADPEYVKKFDYLVFVGYWQMYTYVLIYHLPIEKCIVLKNALVNTIDVNVFDKWAADKDTIDIIYTSTPQRGLHIAYEVFNELYEDYKNIKLHVYSSFDIYGHPNRNEPFEELYEKCRNHPGIEYYGSRLHAEIEEALKKSDIWILPSIWPETSCIAAMEAMSAANIIVCSNLAALPETTANFSVMYPFVRNLNGHAGIFYQHMVNIIDMINSNRKTFVNHMVLQKTYADSFYNWNLRGKEWTTFLRSIE